LTLAGHYGTRVEVDVCDPCCLIWFDDVESVRISKPGIADLVKVVHAAMSSDALHSGAASLAAVQHCPVCAAQLRQVYNATRYGRTSQLQCPHGHGYYQSYILYLAEKGFVRPIQWSDIRDLIDKAKELFCGNCGGNLELRPQESCPYCRSDIAVLDPGRLASAVGAGLSEVKAKPEQSSCHACGSPVDPTRDTSCPQCHALLKRADTQAAVDAISQPAVPRENAARLEKMDAVLAAPIVDAPKMPVELNQLPFRIIAMLAIILVGMGIKWMAERETDPVVILRSDKAEEPMAIDSEAPADDCEEERTGVQLRAISVRGAEGSPRTLEQVQAVRAAWSNGMAYADVLRHYAAAGARASVFGKKGGGFLAPSDLPEELADLAHCQKLFVISQPVYSDGSYHLVQILQAR
jgi:hypothetical protein